MTLENVKEFLRVKALLVPLIGTILAKIIHTVVNIDDILYMVDYYVPYITKVNFSPNRNLTANTTNDMWLLLNHHFKHVKDLQLTNLDVESVSGSPPLLFDELEILRIASVRTGQATVLPCLSAHRLKKIQFLVEGRAVDSVGLNPGAVSYPIPTGVSFASIEIIHIQVFTPRIIQLLANSNIDLKSIKTVSIDQLSATTSIFSVARWLDAFSALRNLSLGHIYQRDEVDTKSDH